MKSEFGKYGPVDDEFVIAFRGKRDIQVWRGMAQSIGKVDHDKDFYYIDTGYFNGYDGTKHKEWHRITKNNYQVLSHVGYEEIKKIANASYPEDKWRKVFNQSYHSYKPKEQQDGDKIMMIEPSLKIFKHYNIDNEQWQRSVISKLRNYTDREIIFRSKPSRRERLSSNRLEDQLRKDKIFCTITFASVAGLHSVMAGVPAIVLGPSAGDYLSNKNISDIENPYFPDGDKIREHLFFLTQCQFNIEEIKNGTAWWYINELQGENKYEKDKGVVSTTE